MAHPNDYGNQRYYLSQRVLRAIERYKTATVESATEEDDPHIGEYMARMSIQDWIMRAAKEATDHIASAGTNAATNAALDRMGYVCSNASSPVQTLIRADTLEDALETYVLRLESRKSKDPEGVSIMTTAYATDASGRILEKRAVVADE